MGFRLFGVFNLLFWFLEFGFAFIGGHISWAWEVGHFRMVGLFLSELGFWGIVSVSFGRGLFERFGSWFFESWLSFLLGGFLLRDSVLLFGIGLFLSGLAVWALDFGWTLRNWWWARQE